jgi:alkylation response protein AidB-like acyl-CoA dehydrogenase
MGAIFPEELGGAGLGYIEYSIIIEELSRVDGSVGIIVAAHTSLCSNHILRWAATSSAAATFRAWPRANGWAAGR